MSGRRFDAVVFDLFNTIVRWKPDRLPTMERDGRRFPTTLPFLFPVLERALGGPFDRDGFVERYLEVLREIESERGVDAVEITCRDRFERALRQLPLSADQASRLARDLTSTHMAAVRAVTVAPDAWVGAIRTVGSAYRTAILSNFDDGRTGHEIVRDTGLGDVFDAVVISADVGFRKPHPRIFHEVLARLDLDPQRVLHVGDTAREDVLGAHGVGIPVVWLSDGRGSFPDDLPGPDYVLSDVTALPALLGLP